MTTETLTDAYGQLTSPDTLTFQRWLPGPAERIWAYLTDSDLRRRWFAAGDMQPAADTPFEFVWRNDELTVPPGERPAGVGGENRMQCRIVAFDAPHRLVVTWGEKSEVSFVLQPKGEKVLLTLEHRRVADRSTLLNVSTGWHAHLDLLAAQAGGYAPEPFWDACKRLRGDYEKRLS